MFKVISLHGVVFSYLFYTRVTFSGFLPLKDLNPMLFLPEPTYLSVPIFPLVLHRRESFSFNQLLQSRSICSSPVIL